MEVFLKDENQFQYYFVFPINTSVIPGERKADSGHKRIKCLPHICHNVDNIQIHNQQLTKKQFFLNHKYGNALLSKVNSTMILALGIIFVRKNKWSF